MSKNFLEPSYSEVNSEMQHYPFHSELAVNSVAKDYLRPSKVRPVYEKQ